MISCPCPWPNVRPALSLVPITDSACHCITHSLSQQTTIHRLQRPFITYQPLSLYNIKGLVSQPLSSLLYFTTLIRSYLTTQQSSTVLTHLSIFLNTPIIASRVDLLTFNNNLSTLHLYTLLDPFYPIGPSPVRALQTTALTYHNNTKPPPDQPKKHRPPWLTTRWPMPVRTSSQSSSPTAL